MRYRLIVVLLAILSSATAQDIDGLFARLQGFKHPNGQYKFFNTDGIEITCIPQDGILNPKTIAKKYRQFKVKADELIFSDTLIGKPCYYQTSTLDDATQEVFFMQHNSQLLAVAFQASYKVKPQFEREFIKLFTENKIPEENYQALAVAGGHVDFAGRKITAHGCRWMNPNNLQCPYNGQMDWSSYKTEEGATKMIDQRYKFLSTTKGGKILSDEQVDILFEGVEVKARKVAFDFKGVRSALAGLSGGETLTIYLVIAPVRDKYVSCIGSFWNNDHVGPNGLPLLLSEVMILK